MVVRFLLMFILILNDGLLVSNKPDNSEDGIIIYAAPINDFRRIPMNKDLLKYSYRIKLDMPGKNSVNDFLNGINIYMSKGCDECLQPIDSRVYIEIYKKGKVFQYFEISAGGSCMKTSQRSYCLSKDFYNNFLMNYFPKVDQTAYLPLFATEKK